MLCYLIDSYMLCDLIGHELFCDLQWLTRTQ